jgi:hypothetical protein
MQDRIEDPFADRIATDPNTREPLVDPRLSGRERMRQDSLGGVPLFGGYKSNWPPKEPDGPEEARAILVPSPAEDVMTDTRYVGRFAFDWRRGEANAAQVEGIGATSDPEAAQVQGIGATSDPEAAKQE